MKWAEHVARVEYGTVAHRVLVGKLEENRQTAVRRERGI